jgi:hypothetical protein
MPARDCDNFPALSLMPPSILCDTPSYFKQLNKFCLLLQLAFDSLNQSFPLTIHFVLSVEKGSSFLVALGFQGLDLFLSGQLFFQSQCGGGGSAGLLDLPVQFFDLAFQADFKVIGPAVQLIGFGFEKAGVTLGYLFLNQGLTFL